MIEKMELSLQDGSITELDNLINTYDDYENLLIMTEYLADITEDVIFSSLKDAIRMDHSTPFTGFNQDHRDSYIRLKFRSNNAI